MPPLSPNRIAKASREAPERLEVGSIVEYEQHGKPILGVVVGEKRSKWVMFNQSGQELELEAARLYLYPEKMPPNVTSREKQKQFLIELASECDEASEKLDLQSLWELVPQNRSEIKVKELTEILHDENTLRAHLSTRRALLRDKIFFKRGKLGFQPRTAEVVEELKKQSAAEAGKARERQALISAIRRRLAGETEELPENVYLLEDLAAFGMRAAEAKEACELLEEIAQTEKISLEGKIDERAFELLCRVNHFTEHTNLELIRFGRRASFSKAAQSELETIRVAVAQIAKTRTHKFDGPRLISIDAADTQDIDDALSLEQTETGYRLGIHISDVASVFPMQSAVEKEAFARGITLYFADDRIPMLPRELSEDILSLKCGEPRLALSYLIDFDRNFAIVGRQIVPSSITVGKRLTYDQVDEVLFEEAASPEIDTELKQLLVQMWQIVSHHETERISRGAMAFSRRELAPVLRPDKSIALEAANEDTPARKLVSESMILANETTALYAKKKGFPIFFRSQEAPDRELQTIGAEIADPLAREYYRRSFLKRSIVGFKPLPHSALALDAYTQITAPIRRSMDLINQRQLVAELTTGKPAFDESELQTFRERLETSMDEATHIQRERSRYWLLLYILQENITEFDATVVKIDGVKPLAELDRIFILSPFTPVAGKGGEAKKMGDKVRLRVEVCNPRRGALVLREIAGQ